MQRNRLDGFAVAALAVAALSLVAVAIMAAITRPSDTPATASDQPTGVDLSEVPEANPNIDIADLLDASAQVMSSVTSVEFSVERGGAPVYIDSFESIEVNALVGQFVVPGQAQATIDVTVDGNLNTRIGAVALDAEVWISNPVTGRFEPLPAGYDIDPSRFFDPTNGWRPLIENLTDTELVGIEDRGGERYHVRGVATADDVNNITAGLISGESVPVDLWFAPGEPYLTAAEFQTGSGDNTTTWTLGLDRYNAPFSIEPPPDITASTSPSTTGTSTP